MFNFIPKNTPFKNRRKGSQRVYLKKGLSTFFRNCSMSFISIERQGLM